jgi:hypothetical protein
MGITSPSPLGERETALMNFYSAERRAGATPLEANERTHFYAKRLDALFERQQELVKAEMESES